MSAALSQEIAARLPAHPEWIAFARANLDNWSRRNAHAPGLLQCYDEWRAILDCSLDDVLAVLLGETEEAVRLRHNSPFAGVLTPQEVWAIKDRVRHEATGS